MATPWFEPNTFGAWYGAMAGGVGGSLVGLWGALAGTLAPRGKGRGLVLGGFGVFFVCGLASLGLGVAALASGQPYGIWYPPLMVGIVLSGVIGGLLPAVRKRYAEAEARRLEAEGIRRG
jgi:hypothetical protein